MEKSKTTNREEKFVLHVLELIKNKGARAALRRASHDTTEYQSWEYLAPWCDLERPEQRKSFALIASSIARANPDSDGVHGLGKSLASAYSRENRKHEEQNSPARARLRRLLACKSAEEVVKFLRSTLRLLESRGVSIRYSEILRDLLFFNRYGENTKARWAKDFYGSLEEE